MLSGNASGRNRGLPSAKFILRSGILVRLVPLRLGASELLVAWLLLEPFLRDCFGIVAGKTLEQERNKSISHLKQTNKRNSEHRM